MVTIVRGADEECGGSLLGDRVSKPTAMTVPSGPGSGEDGGEPVMQLAPVTRVQGLHDRLKGGDLFRVMCKGRMKQDVAFTNWPCSHTLDSESHRTFSFLGRF